MTAIKLVLLVLALTALAAAVYDLGRQHGQEQCACGSRYAEVR